MSGLTALFWDGVTDIIAVGHNKLSSDAKFTPFKVGYSSRVDDLYYD